jgi:hypothetical protein
LVLAIGVSMANEWSSAVMAACKPVSAALPWWTTYSAPPTSIITTICSGSMSVTDMLDFAALSIVFMIVTVAVPYTAAGIAGGSIGLALNHAFEAAFIARTVIRPLTSAVQTGFDRLAQLGNPVGDKKTDANAWVGTMNLGRQSQQLGNIGPNNEQRVAAPAAAPGTSVIPGQGPASTLISARTTPDTKGGSVGVSSKATNRI